MAIDERRITYQAKEITDMDKLEPIGTMRERVVELFREAQRKALENDIRPNVIVIDRKFALSKACYVRDFFGLATKMPPILFGMKVVFDDVPLAEAAFAMMEVPNPPEGYEEKMERLEKENEELRGKIDRMREMLES